MAGSQGPRIWHGGYRSYEEALRKAKTIIHGKGAWINCGLCHPQYSSRPWDAGVGITIRGQRLSYYVLSCYEIDLVHAFRRIGIIAPAGAVKSIDTAAVPANPADLRFAQRPGRKCQENLVYGRTGSYGCG
jgi:hypothetical protein